MKDEIKEILEDYKKLAGEITEKLDNTAEYESWLIVQDYFDKLLDYITNLQEENQKFKNWINVLNKNNHNYKSRNEKAIEYVKKESKICYSNQKGENPLKVMGNFMWHTDKLLNILEGDDNNESR